MKFSKEPHLIREPPLSEQVTDFLSAEIREGNIKPGELLPSESELSYRFNVSRPVIREALSKLKHRGLVASKQGARTRVANDIGIFYEIDIQNMSKAEHTAGVYELKVLFEGDAAALAASRCSPKEIAYLKTILQRLSDSLQKAEGGTSANYDFHETIIKAGRNDLLAHLIRYINEKLWEVFDRDPGHMKNLPLTGESLQEHVDIYSAISAGDPDRARSAVYQHLIKAAHRRGIKIGAHSDPSFSRTPDARDM